jgi:hypothetical protein
MCSEPSAFYNVSTQKVLFTVPGMYVICYVIESLLQSSLQCFYDKICINKLVSSTAYSSKINVTVLNHCYQVAIRKLHNARTYRSFNGRRMEFVTIHDNYYKECEPVHVRTSMNREKMYFEIIMSLVGLRWTDNHFELAVPRLVTIITRKTKERQQQSVYIIGSG